MNDGDSAWNKRFKKGRFQGPVILFGCLVDFKQTPERADKMPKAAPDAVKLNPGGIWNGEFYFVALREFADMDFSMWGSAEMCQCKPSKKLGGTTRSSSRCWRSTTALTGPSRE